MREVRARSDRALEMSRLIKASSEGFHEVLQQGVKLLVNLSDRVTK